LVISATLCDLRHYRLLVSNELSWRYIQVNKKMIVIFGNQGDICSWQTYEYLKQQGQDVVFIDMASDYLSTSGINWSFACSDKEGFITVNSQKIPLKNITSVLARMVYSSYKEPQLSQKDQDYISSESYATLIGLLNSLDCLVVNRPKPGMVRAPILVNREQIEVVKQCGLKLPNMLVTASPERALSFYNSHNQIAIIGSPSTPFFLDLIKGEEGVSKLELVLNQQQPIYLQEIPQGQWLQVFVVDNRVFGSSFWFNSQIGVNFPKTELSPELQEQCCKLAQVLELDFMQVRLVQTEQSEAYCYDINEFPSYIQCDKELQEGIKTALAELLEKGNRGAK
jgi:hypothetical protein